MSSNDDIRAMFFDECNDLMEALFEGLALMEGGAADAETVNAVFRAVHSVKGGAGAFKLNELVSFAHKFETVLDEVRADRLDTVPALVQTLLRAADHLVHLIEASHVDGVIDRVRGDVLLSELDVYIEPLEAATADLEFQPMAINLMDLAFESPAEETVKVRFRPFAKLYQNGHDPLFLIDALRALGALTVELDFDALAALDDFTPNTPTLTFLLTFTAEDAHRTVEDVFEFVEGICELEISVPADRIEEMSQASAPLLLDAREKEAAFALTPDVPPAMTRAKPVREEKARARKDAPVVQATLRVELDKVDRLINTVGELIINQAMIAQRIEQLELPANGALETDMADYKMLSRELQEGVMSIRAQPVKSLFQRMARITREAGDALGKPVRLVTRGENTEVDKTVIERLADPLTHMIRNAVDHGLEKSEVRFAKGKPETGEISLSARHKSGSVLIEIADDGAGLNRERILGIAVEKGLVSKDVDLLDSEIDKLLFLPGFSTSAEVSNLSGRGVGMDVVKMAVQALGGRVSIASTPGQGTVFSIILPLTLAVMDGIVVSVADETMIVPITAVIETLRPKPSEIHNLGNGQKLLMVRGEYLPVVCIRERLGLTGRTERASDPVLVLVEGVDQTRCALSVDDIHDQRQVVIKSVGGNYGAIPGVSAATILGTGKIALILDTDHLSSSGSSTIPSHDVKASVCNE